ncbi:MAG TPA: metalloregulator ArsR/SmtB family transcription factor [Candidatus Limnocylindrales bacterium]
MNTKLTNPSSPALAPHAMASLQAIAEPTRARIVALLGHGEHCVCDVGDTLALSPALVSHHLRSLRESGLLRERRSGRWVYYSLDLEALVQLREAVTRLLTPNDEAAAACLCSDCGPERGSRPLNPMLPDFGSFPTGPS